MLFDNRKISEEVTGTTTQGNPGRSTKHIKNNKFTILELTASRHEWGEGQMIGI